ncbi:deoxyribodipyrimidine photo-lyase isoform X1 [Vanessa tameamea]|uniref:Deoxyribodipyrimidine photo-lyase n=1 Tax=Vanessa tameamea TaxID=334116 RepID=A0A8B8HP59_VANTA|nr:deoxyribodipyrimidine photo-lyase isoform X1 [Vanessa tameamea]
MITGSKRTVVTISNVSTAAKKAKNLTNANIDIDNIKNDIQKKREDTAESILNFSFNKKRLRIVSQEQMVADDCEGIVYWMSRDSRVQDNWAFLFAQKLALKNKVPLHVCFCLIAKYLDASVRQFDFLLKGLEQVAEECNKLNISFHLLEGSGGEVLPQWVLDHKIGAVVCDFNPLRVPLGWLEDAKRKLKKDVPLIQVDAHNVVPCWVASDKQEYSARTIRNKITSKLEEFLTEFPPVIKHPYTSKFKPEPIDWEEAIKSRDADETVKPVDWATPGYECALQVLKSFIDKRLKIYATKRNDPTQNALSNLSPWFHFGQISVQRVALCVQEYKSKHTESVNAFLEEAIVRRELADNFCFYCKHYDSIEGASAWAQKTLNDHKLDKKAHIYKLEQLSQAITHDDLWNAAQIQMMEEGKMHGFLRMYWCKKILEWSETPEQALECAIYLNDHYSIDGRDPSGYVGCMWSICGIHDQGWAERAIFGKIRYMNYEGCKRKFDVATFVQRYVRKTTSESEPLRNHWTDFDENVCVLKLVVT